MSKDTKDYTRKDISKDTIEFEVSIKRATFQKSYDALLEQEAKKTDLKGFRKGEVPKEVVEERFEDSVLIQAFEQIAPLYVNSAIMAEELTIIAPPAYKSVPELKGKDDLKITVSVTIMPEFKLGNMKKVKIKTDKIEVTEKEMDDVFERLQANPQTKTDKLTDKWAEETGKKLLMEDVKTLDDMKKEIKKIVIEQKEGVKKQEYESDALKQAIEICKIVIPQAAVEYEAQQREQQFIHQLEHQEMSFEDWAKNSNTTPEKVRETWIKDAQEALEADVFLKLYAEENKIEVSEEELEEAINKIKASKQVEDESVYENKEWIEYMKQIEAKRKGFDKFITEILGTKEEKKKAKKK